MSFVYRDYAGPRVVANNVAILKKSLFSKLCSQTSVDGVQVFDKIIFYNGDNSVVSKDSTFIRLLQLLGMKRKELVDIDHIWDLAQIWFYLDSTKYKFDDRDKAFLTNKLNYEYLDQMTTLPEVHPYYRYTTYVTAGDVVATLPVGGVYTFSTGSSVSGDGYYSITPTGVISITEAGIEANVNIVMYGDSLGYQMYSVKKVLSDVTTYTDIYLQPQREYIDIKITLGGVNINMPADSGFTPTSGGVPNMFADLPTIRGIVESNPVGLLGGISTSRITTPSFNSVVRYGSNKLSNVVGVASVDPIYGNASDTIALLDNGELFTVESACFNEKIGYTSVPYYGGNARGTVVKQVSYNMYYEYTKRYRVNHVYATDTSVAIVTAFNAYQSIVASASTGKLPLSTTRWNAIIMPRVRAAINNSANTNAISQMIHNLTRDSLLFNDNAFYKGKLRVDTFNAMKASEFNVIFSSCFALDYKREKKNDGGMWGKIIAIVIIIVAIVIVVAFSMIGMPAIGLTIASLFLTVAGAVYAKNFPGATGAIKMIGTCAQWTGYAAMAFGIANIAQGLIEQLSTKVAIDAAVEAGRMTLVEAAMVMPHIYFEVAVLSLQLVATTAGVLVMAGVGDDKFKKDMMLVGGVAALLAGGAMFYSTIGTTSDSVMKDVAGYLSLANDGLKVYSAINLYTTDYEQLATEEQATKEDGVEALFDLRELSMENDALLHMHNLKESSFGGNKTEYLISQTMA